MPDSPLAATPSPLADPSYRPDFAGTFSDPTIAAERRAAEARDREAQTYEKLGREGEQLGQERTAAVHGRTEKVRSAIDSPHPRIPDLEKPPEPPKPEDYKKFSMEWLGAMAVLGAFAGKKVRNAGNAPLKAFSGALEGWQQGNMQAYKDAAAQWEQKQRQVLELNRQRMDKYRATLEDRRLTVDEQMNALKITSMEYEDRLMWDATTAGNSTKVAAAYEMSANAHRRATETTQKLTELLTQQNETAVERANQMRDYIATPQGQAEFNNMPPAQKLQLGAFIKTYADQPVPAPAFNPNAATPGQDTGGVPAVEPPPGSMDASTTPQPGQPGRSMPGDLRGPVPTGLKSADMAARQFRIESYRAGKGEPTSADWATFYRQQHPGRSAPALALQQFIEDTEVRTGQPPNAEEIARFAARFAAQTSAGRAVGGRLGNIEVGVQEFKNVMPLASEASKNVARLRFVPYNVLVNNLRVLRSDPRYQEFVDAVEAAKTAYSSTMSRSGANTVHAQERAAHVLTTATSDEAFQAGLRMLQREVDAVEKAPGQAMAVIDRLGIGDDGSKQAAPPPPAAGDDGWGEMKVH